MNIVVINGSPRGKNSLSLGLTQNFLMGIQSDRASKDLSPAKVQTFSLVSMDIGNCTGCFHCWKNGQEQCIHQDDMAKIMPEYTQADLVIWSMPLYHFGMPALAKKFIERTLPTHTGEIIADKKGSFTHPLRGQRLMQKGNSTPRNLYIGTCGFPSRENNYEALYSHFDRLFGYDGHGWDRIDCVQGELLGIPELKDITEPYRKLVSSAGVHFHQCHQAHHAWQGFPKELRTNLDRPLMDIPTFLSLANASWTPETKDGTVQISPYQEALTLLTQMAILYNPDKLPKKPASLAFNFQEISQAFYLIMDPQGCHVTTEALELGIIPRESRGSIDTSFATWQKISRGEIDGAKAMMDGLYRFQGAMEILMSMGDGLFSGRQARVVTINHSMTSPWDQPDSKIVKNWFTTMKSHEIGQ